MLDGLQGVANMIDSILIFGVTKTEHNVRLCVVLELLKTVRITLNPDNSSFAVRQVAF